MFLLLGKSRQFYVKYVVLEKSCGINTFTIVELKESIQKNFHSLCDNFEIKKVWCQTLQKLNSFIQYYCQRRLPKRTLKPFRRNTVICFHKSDHVSDKSTGKYKYESSKIIKNNIISIAKYNPSGGLMVECSHHCRFKYEFMLKNTH